MPHPDTVRRALTRAARRGPLLDPRYALGRALQAAQDELVSALGGPDHVSPQQRTLVALAARTELLIAHYDLWLVEQPDLTSPHVLAVVQVRRALADSLVRYLTTLGLDRVDTEGQNAWNALVAEFPPQNAPGSG